MAWSTRAVDGSPEEGGFVQWVSSEAGAWWRQARKLGEIDPETLNPDQCFENVRRAAEIVANCYRAIDLPPTSDPAYRDEWELVDHEGPNLERLAGGEVGGTERSGTWVAEVLANAAVPDRCEPSPLTVHRRAWLDPGARIVGELRGGNLGAPRAWTGWEARRDTCPFWGGGVPTEGWPSCRANFELFQRVARALSERGIDGTISAGRMYAIRSNLALSELAGLALPEELRRWAELARAGGPRWLAKAREATLGLSGACATFLAATAGANPYAWACLAVSGVAYLATELLPWATGGEHDTFGRLWPPYEAPRISGSIGPDREPSHAVEAAPLEALPEFGVAPDLPPVVEDRGRSPAPAPVSEWVCVKPKRKRGRIVGCRRGGWRRSG